MEEELNVPKPFADEEELSRQGKSWYWQGGQRGQSASQMSSHSKYLLIIKTNSPPLLGFEPVEFPYNTTSGKGWLKYN
jgi:hypothetical protein